MRRSITAITFGVMTATALSGVAQTPDRGYETGSQPRPAPVDRQGQDYGRGPDMVSRSGDSSQQAEDRVQHLTRQLDLSEDQQTRIKAILQEQRGKHSGRGSRAETRDRISEVLTSEQRARLEEIRAQRKKSRSEGQGSGRAPDSAAQN
ncbi:MAG: hypothetical protein U9Q81_16215 [Pseudomonadota bacterium]|nr:hypothetical protein [Pseudomonadota bacterium]